jgi:hypothetical protein
LVTLATLLKRIACTTPGAVERAFQSASAEAGVPEQTVVTAVPPATATEGGGQGVAPQARRDNAYPEPAAAYNRRSRRFID